MGGNREEDEKEQGSRKETTDGSHRNLLSGKRGGGEPAIGYIVESLEAVDDDL